MLSILLNVAKVEVEGSNPFARSNPQDPLVFLQHLRKLFKLKKV